MIKRGRPFKLSKINWRNSCHPTREPGPIAMYAFAEQINAIHTSGLNTASSHLTSE